MFNITAKDLQTFERKLIAAARERNEAEVNVINERRGYILYGAWQATDDRTPEEFAGNQVSLVLDAVDNIAAL